MKLHTKLALSLLVGLLLVVTVAQVLQYAGVTGRISRLSAQDMSLLRAREEQAARNLCASVEHSVAGSLQRGEMQKFTRLLQEQRKVKGLIEFSLFDRDGAVSHSSDSAALKRRMPEALKARLLTDCSELTDSTADCIRIYRPQPVTPDCVRCHTSWKPGQVGGVTYFAFSTAELAKAEQDAVAVIGSTKGDLLRNGLWTIVGVVVVLVAAVYVLVRRFIGRPLGLFVSLLTKFETDEGDLTRRIPIQSRDEIGGLARLFNRFVQNLERVIGQSKNAAGAVSADAAQQARAIEETTSSMTEMAATTRQSAEHAQQANELIRSANTGITHAHDSLETLTAAMDQISVASNEVVRIVKLIDQIATQTNLLAINAAVEAAHAGQAGAGFAVVATGVRDLAKQSAESAHTIAELVEQTVDKIQIGKRLVDTTRGAFADAVARSRKAAGLVEQIAGLSREQAQGIEQVSGTLGEVDHAVRKSAAQAQELAAVMATFKTGDADAQTAPLQARRSSPGMKRAA